MSWEVRTMRSATSYFNFTLLRKNFARFWPIWSLYGLFWLAVLPLNILSNRIHWDGVVCTPSSRQRNNLHFTHENPSCIPYGAGCYAASRRSWTSIGVRTPRPRWRRWKL